MEVVSRKPRRFGPVGIAAWFAVMLGVGASLLARHVVALPTPAGHEKLAASLHDLRSDGAANRWLAVHVLSSECRCSQRVAEHLASTVRPSDFAEIVLWVGDEAPPQALTARFDVRRLPTDALGTFGIEAVPLLVVADPSGRLQYVGGYTSRKQGPVIEDLRLLAAARSATNLEALPLFGCAISERLTRQLSFLPAP